MSVARRRARMRSAGIRPRRRRRRVSRAGRSRRSARRCTGGPCPRVRVERLPRGSVLRPSVAEALPPGFQVNTVISGLDTPTAVAFSPDGRVFVAEKSGTHQGLHGPERPDAVRSSRTSARTCTTSSTAGLLGLGPARRTSRPSPTCTPCTRTTATSAAPRPSGERPACCPTRVRSPGRDARRLPRPPPASRGCRDRRCDAGPGAGPHRRAGASRPDPLRRHVAFGPTGAVRRPAATGRASPSRTRAAGTCRATRAATLRRRRRPAFPPSAEGGALRSQDVRTLSDATGLNGRPSAVTPSTGAAMPGNPLAGNRDPNAARIVAHGLRNPFRVAFRPGTDDLWIGDVGWHDFEEIDGSRTRRTRCRELRLALLRGNRAAADLGRARSDDLCEQLYPQSGAHDDARLHVPARRPARSGRQLPDGQRLPVRYGVLRRRLLSRPVPRRAVLR